MAPAHSDLVTTLGCKVSKNTHINGAKSEVKFMLECLKREWEVTKPLSDIYPYDFVIRRDKKRWETAQVKTAYITKNGNGKGTSLACNVRQRSGGKNVAYPEGAFEVLIVVYIDTIWLIPWSAIKGISSHISMRGFEKFILREGHEPDPSNDETLTAEMLSIKSVSAKRKLTCQQISEIRKRYDLGATQESLAAKYNVGKSSIGRIVRYEYYK